jgi:hypothetical protein
VSLAKLGINLLVKLNDPNRMTANKFAICTKIFVKLVTGVNITNILLAAFCKKVLCKRKLAKCCSYNVGVIDHKGMKTIGA